MNSNRREFIRGTAWMGLMAVAAGCASKKMFAPTGAPMQDFAAAPLKRVRVGVIGLGNRGRGAVHRLAMVPGVDVVALCDLREEKVNEQVSWLKHEGFPAPRMTSSGDEECWKRLCDFDGIDAVYNVTPWHLHAPVALYAMKAGKHVFTEVPAAFTVDECWELVETSEATRRHCQQLENCCYGEMEMLMLELCRQGVVGEILHGECSYIHDLRGGCWSKYHRDWRLHWNAEHKGNQYPTHGLGPIAWCMDINRGDRFEYLTSLESKQANFELYAKEHFAADSWQRAKKIEMGDMNTTLVKTALGRSILIQHDVSSPRPYTRIDKVTGTKGIFWGMPWRTYGNDKTVYKMGFEEKNGDGVHKFFTDEKAEEYRSRYMHPLWSKIGKIAQEVGGHGGMDFIMDLRWAYCLQNGLPVDQNVYDLAAWCSICELSERSVRNRSNSVDIPDFTRGAWKSAAKLGNLDIDLSKLEFRRVKKDKDALNV